MAWQKPSIASSTSSNHPTATRALPLRGAIPLRAERFRCGGVSAARGGAAEEGGGSGGGPGPADVGFADQLGAEQVGGFA
jgi:hypothetical protein